MINLRKYQVHMKLQEKFKLLEPTAFGPWLAVFKKLFLSEELAQDIEQIQPDELKEYNTKIRELKDERTKLSYELIPTNEIRKEIVQLEKEAKNVTCKVLLILSNKVIEVNDNVLATGGDVRRVDKYKANINLSFNEICNKQMEDFYKLITQLPEDRKEWSNYLQKLEKDKGYNPAEAVKKVVDINRLVKKFEQSSNKEYHNNFKLVADGTNKLLDYIDHLPQEVPLTGQEESHIIAHM
ncbi:MAG: hypothetical protein ACRYE8_00465 [Janthinobacterium lividum]